MKHYDIIIAGAGASGVFMSYELAKLNVNASVLAATWRAECALSRRAKPRPA